jgi:hypothetical protein
LRARAVHVAIEDSLRHGIRPIAFPGERLRSLTMHQSPPTRFAEAYGDDIRGADNVTAYLNANVVELEAPAPPARIHRARVAACRAADSTSRPRCSSSRPVASRTRDSC